MHCRDERLFPRGIPRRKRFVSLSSAANIAVRYALHIQLWNVFDWDRDNLKKIRAHGLDTAAIEEALSISPILIYEQDADGESRYVYYGETVGLRLLAVVLTERNGKIRVMTAYELDAGQKRDYLERRMKGE